MHGKMPAARCLPPLQLLHLDTLSKQILAMDLLQLHNSKYARVILEKVRTKILLQAS